ncbi:MAG: 5-formyltetrahydrofolate cyclo-ligase [Bacilli bacterium]
MVPGICFDKDNNRIGYGKGFYDRFLKDKDIYTIGITYTQCIIDNIPYEINDIKLNKVLTSN